MHYFDESLKLRNIFVEICASILKIFFDNFFQNEIFEEIDQNKWAPK